MKYRDRFTRTRFYLQNDSLYTAGLVWLNYLASLTALALYNALGLTRKTARFVIVCLSQREDQDAVKDLNLPWSVDDYFDEDGETYNLDDLTKNLRDLYKKGSRSTQKQVDSCFKNSLTKHIKDIENLALNSEMEEKFKNLASILELSDLEKNILRLLHVDETDVYDLRNFIDGDINIFNLVNRPLLSRLLKSPTEDIARTLHGKMVSLGVIDRYGSSGYNLGPTYFELLDTPNDLDKFSSFVPVKRAKLLESDFFVNPKSLDLLKGLIQSDSPTPTHILIHGPAGVGKTEFARTLAASCEIEAYEVLPEDTVAKHRTNLLVAASLIRRRPGGLLIIDEAEELLNLDGGSMGSVFASLFGPRSRNKSWINSFMDKPETKCLWIVNNSKHLDDSTARRFAYSICFPELGRRERTKIWRTSKTELTSLGSKILSEAALERLAEERQIIPGVINQCFQKGLEAGAKDEATLMNYLNQMMSAHKKLTGVHSRPITLPQGYRADFLNITPSANDLVKRLKEYLVTTLALPESEREGLKFLFHGVPGTGKTKLAYHLAKELDLELIHANVSDILSCYYGETEAKIANLFEQASAVGGLLLIDEIDSFVASRDHRMPQFLISVINEFLIGLERYNGLFIGATNRFDSLDQAALRRFNFKIEFKPLTANLRLAFFENYFKPLTGSAVTEPEKVRLMSLPSLTPGDFGNVAAWAKWFPDDLLDNFDLIEKLSQEAAIREKSYMTLSPGLEEEVALEPEAPKKVTNTIN